MPTEFVNVMAWLFGLSMFNWFASTLLFARTSVRYIDSELEKNGAGKPAWDGIGIRVSIYALVILSKWFAKTTLVAGAEIRTVARKKDYYLALWFEISLLVFLVVAFEIYPFISD